MAIWLANGATVVHLAEFRGSATWSSRCQTLGEAKPETSDDAPGWRFREDLAAYRWQPGRGRLVDLAHLGDTAKVPALPLCERCLRRLRHDTEQALAHQERVGCGC